jgi:hypothetical protein
MVLEHIRRLNDVIINADQNHVVLVHADRPSGLPYGMSNSLTSGCLRACWDARPYADFRVMVVDLAES